MRSFVYLLPALTLASVSAAYAQASSGLPKFSYRLPLTTSTSGQPNVPRAMFRIVEGEPSYIDFGRHVPGTDARGTPLLVRNVGTSTGGLEPPALVGNTRGDFLLTSSCSDIAPAQSCEIASFFRPSSDGAQVAEFSVDGQRISLLGQGYTPPFTRATALSNLQFAATALGGASPVETLRIRNDGNAELRISSFAGVVAPFRVVAHTCARVSPGTVCDVDVAMDTGKLGDFITTIQSEGADTNASATVTGRVESAIGTWISPMLEFGVVPLWDAGEGGKSMSATLKNTGNSPGAFDQKFKALTGPFYVQDLSECRWLLVGQSCTAKFWFRPNSEQTPSSITLVEAQGAAQLSNALTLRGTSSGILYQPTQFGGGSSAYWRNWGVSLYHATSRPVTILEASFKTPGIPNAQGNFRVPGNAAVVLTSGKPSSINMSWPDAWIDFDLGLPEGTDVTISLRLDNGQLLTKTTTLSAAAGPYWKPVLSEE